MTVQAIYRPPFRKQLGTGSPTAKDDCGPAAARHAILRHSLGTIDPTCTQIRAKVGKTTGQFIISDVDRALRAYGITPSATWDRFDDYHVDELERDLGTFYAVVLGDYDEVPLALKGDREFMGNHFTFFNESVGNGDLVYDSLDDGRIDAPSTTRRVPRGPIVWPDTAVNPYLHGLSDKQDEDVTVCLIRRRLLNRKAGTVNVRVGPSRQTAALASWVKGSVEYGSVVSGESIGGNDQWYRIWYPVPGTIAFVHSSVIVVAS